MTKLYFRFLNVKPCSTNDAYVPAYKYVWGKGRKRYKKMYMRKSDELKILQESIAESFESEFFYTKNELYWFSSLVNNLNLGLEFNLKISMPKEDYYTSSGDVTRHDASNFIKTTEDSIMSGIGIDDKRNIKVLSEKGFNEDGVWMIEVSISILSIHNKIDADITNAYINSKGDDNNEA